MLETVPAQYINEPAIGFVYVALLSENAQQKITQLLADISQELPGVVWPMPPEALHLTLCEIVQSRKEYSEDKEELFDKRKQEYTEAAAEVLTEIPRFSVTLDCIEASPEAIIVRTKDSSAFNGIRARLLERITLPEETKTPPNITHSSIARYLKATDVEAVRAVLAKHTVQIEEPITEFKLLKTLIPPLLSYEEITSFDLA